MSISGAADGPPLSSDNILSLQRSIGNRAVSRLLQRKVRVSRPGDADEREADRVAEQVERMPAPASPRKAAPINGAGELKVGRMESSRAGGESQSSMQGGGEPLAESVRAYYEPRFGQDFSGVRVHKDAQAAEAARGVNARAFTSGSDIVFGSGEYAPETAEGGRLLAHELTHVVQQGSAGRAQGAEPAGRDSSNGEAAPAAPDIRQRPSGSEVIQLSPLSDQLAQIWMSGDKGIFFDRLRNLNVSDPDVHEFVFDNLNGDDLWLALNLLEFGIEARWPIHLRVEREMKGWGDSGGAAAAFNILRAANGAESGNARLTATVNRLFAGDDLHLAQNLQAYGPEASWPVPTDTYIVPFDRNSISAPGEQLIFRAEFSYPLANNYHKIVYTGVGGTFDTNAGSGTKTMDGLMSGNVYFFISSAWTGGTRVAVNLQVQCRSTNLVVFTTSWTFSKKGYYPTTMAQQEAEGELPLGSIYSYKLGPDRGADNVDDYIGQTILEKFGQNTCNIALDELKPTWRAANPGITTPEQITTHFFGGSGGNGTFNVTAGDKIYDQHGGGMPDLATFQAALITMKEIYTDLPQTYEAEPGVTLGSYVVRRILKTNGDKKLKKWKV